jgi:plastocyanin domain-containing protein
MKAIIISIVISITFIIGAVMLSTNVGLPGNGNNVIVVDGKQIIEITAKGGFEPKKSVAKAGIPTVIRFETNGTFDCSSSVRIPSMNISKILPQSGLTEIDIGTPTVATLKGSCSMGMYPFEIDFQS